MFQQSDLPKLPHGEGTIFIYSDKTLAYKKTIKLPNGKSVRKTVYAPSVKKCLDAMKQAEHELAKSCKNAERTTLAEGISIWMDTVHKKTVKQQTYDRMQKTLRNQIENKFIGAIPYQSVSSDEIQELINELNERKYSYSTIKKTYDLLNAFYRYASAMYRFDNPMLLVASPKAKTIETDSKELEWLEENEIDMFINACDIRYNTGTLKFKYGYALAANIYLGLRGGELLALQWKDIDFEKQTVYVSKTLVQLNDTGSKVKFVVQSNTKTYKNRYVPINDSALVLLEKHKQNSQFTDPNDYVISTSNRKTNTLKNLSDMIKGIEKAAGIDKGCNTHILRHTCASLYFKKGIPVETIAQILGNTREVCESTYVHFVEEQLKEAASKINIKGE